MITRLPPPPKDLDSFLGRKWLETLTEQSGEITAIADLQFIVLAISASLPNGRRLVGSSDIGLSDGGAGGDLTISLANIGTAGSYNFVTVNAKGRVTSGSTLAYALLSAANTWAADQSVPDEAYGAGWNGSLEVPTKNALYDKIETVVGAGVSLGAANTWTQPQSVPDDPYAAGWNGSVEVPTKNAIYDKIESLPVLASGTYTPTRSAEVNLDAVVTMSQAQYLRVGSTVTVSGQFTADPTTTLTPSSFEMTLPIASNIGAVEDVAGTAFCGAIAGQGAAISGVVANDTALVSWIAVDVTNQVWSYSFSYQII